MQQDLSLCIMSCQWKQFWSLVLLKRALSGLFKSFGKEFRLRNCHCLWEQLWEGSSGMGLKLHLQKKQERPCGCLGEQGSGGTLHCSVCALGHVCTAGLHQTPSLWKGGRSSSVQQFSPGLWCPMVL